jgi:CheY-like chemotaxis protein
MPARNSSVTGPVLIVDDDMDIREILAETLADHGFEVVTAAHGRDALDLMMPVMDGYGFLEERMKDTTLESIPLAVITAGHGVDRRRIARETPIVPKPFEMPGLLRVLRALQARREMSA